MLPAIFDVDNRVAPGGFDSPGLVSSCEAALLYLSVPVTFHQL